MDIYALITADHQRILGLIDELLAINLQAVQQRLFEQLKAELATHIGVKEQSFYKVLLETGSELKTDVERQVRGHDEIRELLERLSEESVSSSSWMVMFGELKHAVEHHVQDEETMMFAKARQVIPPDRAQQLVADAKAIADMLQADMKVQAD